MNAGEHSVESAEFERGYIKGYEDGLLARQSEWMKARREELAEAWDSGFRRGESFANHGTDNTDNPYRTPPGQRTDGGDR